METELITGAVGLVIGILGAYAKTRKYRRILAAVIRGVNAAAYNDQQGEEKRIKHYIRCQSLVERVDKALHKEVRRVEAKGQ